MIQADHPILAIVQQCRLASIGRSTFYHVPRGESAENLGLMVEIDRQFLETPFYGAQQIRVEPVTRAGTLVRGFR